MSPLKDLEEKMMRQGTATTITAIIMAISMLAVLSAPMVAAQDSYVFVAKWGTNGTGDGEFDYPFKIALNAVGEVYVSDAGNRRIEKFDSDGNFITKWGGPGTALGDFDNPCGVAVDSAGNVYVADNLNHRIQKFDGTGGILGWWGSQGSGDGQFEYPGDVAVDSSDNVYVVDSWNQRIQKFTSSGGFVTKWGSNGTGDGQFVEPWGVAVDASGNVYVADYGNNRIQKFTSSGVFITKWGNIGSGDGLFDGPISVTVDTSGNVYVVDYYNHRIQKFTSSGVFITKWGSNGIGDGQFVNPSGIAIGASGTAYVVDFENHRVQMFDPQDLSPPSVVIELPTTNDAYTATSSTLTIGGTASDNIGVTTVTWTNDRGGSGTASGTTDWTVTGITLMEGINVITITARDASDKTGQDTLTVTYSSTVITVASPPRNLQTDAQDSRVVLTWEPPVSDGGASIDHYVVYMDGTDVAHVVGTTTTITGLTNGQQYDFSVAAHNSAGNGTQTAMSSATPTAGAGGSSNIWEGDMLFYLALIGLAVMAGVIVLLLLFLRRK